MLTTLKHRLKNTLVSLTFSTARQTICKHMHDKKSTLGGRPRAKKKKKKQQPRVDFRLMYFTAGCFSTVLIVCVCK